MSSKMKQAFAALGVAASAAVCTLVSVGSDIAAADSAEYTEGLGFGTAVPALAFATAAVAICIAVVLAKRYCKKE